MPAGARSLYNGLEGFRFVVEILDPDADAATRVQGLLPVCAVADLFIIHISVEQVSIFGFSCLTFQPDLIGVGQSHD